MSERFTETVKWFNLSKEHGFIEKKDRKDIFVKYSVI